MRKISIMLTGFISVIVLAVAISCSGVEKKQLGIATYSVKGLESDIEGAFQALADDGYVVMEISNYSAADGTVAGYTPAEYAALAETYGLDIISSHASAQMDVNDVEGTLTAWGKLFDDHQAMGCKYVILPMRIWAGTPEEVKKECDLLNLIGEEANMRGIKFGYHNHNFEFATMKDTSLVYEDFLIENTDPEKVFFQMDVYWVTVGGQDPVTYMQKYPDRFKVLHIKDDYVIGASGKIDYKAIFDQFYANGHTDWFVEMEAKATPEEKQQSLAMMDMLKQMQSNGGSSSGFSMASLFSQQRSQQPDSTTSAAPAPAPLTPEEQLVIALDGIKQSAEYLKISDFVK